MLGALVRAFAQLSDPALRRVLWIGVGAALGLLISLVLVVNVALTALVLVGVPWIDWVIDLMGGLLALVLAVILFPAVAAAVTSLLLDDVARAVEARYYPHLVPGREQGLIEAGFVGVRFLALLVAANLAALLLIYLVPGLNVLAFFLLNGFLLGREYYEAVALRRLDPPAARAFRKQHGGTVFGAGLVIACLMAVPLLNLLTPVLATAFMVHVYHRTAGTGRAG